MLKQKAPEDRKAEVLLVRRLGLPDTFLRLAIQGIEKVAGSPELSSRNKELIFRFLNHISAEVSERRLTFYTHKLRKLAGWLKKDFNVATEEDMRSVLTFLSKGKAREDGSRFSEGSLHGYKVTLKRFYRWLEGDDEDYPRKVRWIKTNGDTARIREPEQLLTPDEVFEMIRQARNPRDKALVSFLYESGARISEMLSMKMRHLEFTSTMVKATLPISKTRPRIIPLVSCTRHLSNWVNYHPLKDNSDAVLWSNMKHDGSKPLASQTVGSILRRIAHNAGIDKRIYPHLFRACSITHKQLAGWPEQAIKAFHGLSKDSKVMKHYSHLSYGNLEQIQRKMNGLPVEDSADMNGGIKCPACGKKNPLYVETCDCGLPTEMKFVPDGRVSTESEIEARLEKKVQEFMESRQVYDKLMERFMNALLERARQSPELLRVIGQVGSTLQKQQVQAGATAEYQN
jgi:site-specific recombinase XerD